MIIKLLGTILSLVVLAFFIGFNLDNKCNVNVLFYTFQNVPVFITIIISFVVGVLFTMPFAFSYKAETIIFSTTETNSLSQPLKILPLCQSSYRPLSVLQSYRARLIYLRQHQKAGF